MAGWSAVVGTFLLAGVVLQLCLSPLCGLATHPLQVAPILLTWLVFTRFAQRWAVPSTFVVTLSTVVFTHRSGISGPLLSHLNWTSRG